MAPALPPSTWRSTSKLAPMAVQPAARSIPGAFSGRALRADFPVVERLTYLSKLPKSLLKPPQAVAARVSEDLVQIQAAKKG